MNHSLSCHRMIVLCLAFTLLIPISGGSEEARVKTHKISDKVYMLDSGSPGNIGAFVGEDGVILIDDQFAPLTEEVIAAIGGITDEPIRFLVNTHAHPDHIGGNENLGKRGVIIVGRDEIRSRMLQGIFGGAPYPEIALPVITFSETVTFHLNGEPVRAFKVVNAHTDSDTVIHFIGSDVIHTGDVFRTTTYPFIDTNSGGSFQGQIEVLGQLMKLGSSKTIFIPGHGKPGTVKSVQEFHTMLVTVNNHVQALVAQGKSLEEVLEADVTKDFDDRWDIKPGDMSHYGKVPFVKMVYRQLRGN